MGEPEGTVAPRFAIAAAFDVWYAPGELGLVTYPF